MSIVQAAGGIALAVTAAAPILLIGVHKKIKDASEHKSDTGIKANAGTRSELSDMSYYDPTPWAGQRLSPTGGLSVDEVRSSAEAGLLAAVIGESAARTPSLKDKIWFGAMDDLATDPMPGTVMMEASAKANLRYKEPAMKIYSEEYRKAYGDTPVQGYTSSFISWALGNDAPQQQDILSVVRALPAVTGQRLAAKIVIRQAMRMASADGSPIEVEKAAAVAAGCIWLAATGSMKEDIAEYVTQYYDLDGVSLTMADTPRDCSVAVPYAVSMFLDCPNVSNTAACIAAAGGPDYAGAAMIACAISGAFYGLTEPEKIWAKAYAPWITKKS